MPMNTDLSPIKIFIERRDQLFYTIISAGGQVLRSESFHTKAAAAMASEVFSQQYRRSN